MSRWVGFLLTLLIGLGLGLAYGWVINPVKYVDTTPATLRADYQTDYVLMAAEAFQGDGSLVLAEGRLALLGERPPLVVVQQAIVAAQKAGYSPGDLELLGKLAAALQAGAPTPAGGAP